ncbi:MAG: FtsH protease activity modulator HflK [Kiritimatiellae bacterium]|jgi:membrane protease subunit HflK|nr:FtsH protease activity modulator HflK [Kiritimatiellia bacterium]
MKEKPRLTNLPEVDAKIYDTFSKAKGKLVYIIIPLLCVIAIFSSFFTIAPAEVGVVLRFGKESRTVTPGLHFKLPFGIETVYKVERERQFKEEFGFRTIRAGIKTQYSTKSFIEESLLLTGDLNAAEIEWIVQYRIENPYNFLFKIRKPVQTLRDINESVMREIVGDRTINEVLTIGREEIAIEAMEKTQALATKYETGIKVYRVVLQSVFPPERVKASFNEVNQAQQERQKMINQAQQEYNKIIPRAKGEATKMIEEAEGYKLERVNAAEGNAARFNSIFTEYLKAPEVTKTRIYLETMESVLKTVDHKIITEKEIMGMLPLYDLSAKGTK